MKYRQEGSNGAKTVESPSSKKNKKNLEENKETSNPRDGKSESNSNILGDITKGKAVFFSEDRSTKRDIPHNTADKTLHETFPAILAKMDQRKEADELDLKLLDLLLKGYDNKRIADTTDNPLSTIQRRTRLIFERGLATSKVEPDYKRLGFKKGFLAIQLKGGKIQSIVERLQGISGIIAISANIGTFPIICTIIYKSVTELWDVISRVQELDNIREVFWSEEIYNYTSIYNIHA